MLNSIRLCDYHYPYAILITKFLHYFEVDLEDEQSELVKSTSEFNNRSLSRMGFTKVNGRWISKGGDLVGSSSGEHAEGEDEYQIATVAIEGDADMEVGGVVLVLMKLDKVLETWVNASHPCHPLRG